MIITSINLNGLELVSKDYYFHLSGLFDFEKDVIVNDLYIDGESYNRSKNKPKVLVLEGWVMSNDESKVFALNKILAGNGLKSLIINNEYLCYVEITNRGSTPDNSHAVTCQLTMPDPYVYAVDTDSISLGAISNASLVLPVVLPFTLGSITGGEGAITNRGNAVAYPVISIIGTCDTITVTNETTGESMSLAVSLGDNDTLIIDNRPDTRGIYLNGNKRMDLKNGNWISCIPGDNVFSFSRNSLQTKQHCTVSLNSRWL